MESIALFGKAATISAILAVAAEHGQSNWDCVGADPVAMLAADRAVTFVRALPNMVPMPEVAPEPDGSISLDWICSRSRIISISVGVSELLAIAWLDGGDSRHAVERFDGESVPPLILDRLGQTISHCPGAADTPHGGEFE